MSSRGEDYHQLVQTGKDLISGTIAGCAGIVVGQPLDTVKVRLQSTTLFKGPWDCLMGTIRQEGTRALFKGMASPLIGNAPLNAIAFGAYGYANRWMDSHSPWLDDYEMTKGIAAGMWAGFLQTAVVTPTELVKCRLQVQTSSALGHKAYDGAMDCVKKSIRAQGVVRGLYTGWFATVLRDVPAFAAYFSTYKGLKEYFRSHYQPYLLPDSSPSLWVSLFAGGVAGMATWSCTYPLDVIKSVQQTLPAETPRNEATIRYIFRSNLAKHGPRFFVRGLSATVIRAFPANAVIFLVYELCMDALGRDHS